MTLDECVGDVGGWVGGCKDDFCLASKMLTRKGAWVGEAHVEAVCVCVCVCVYVCVCVCAFC